MLRYIPLLLLLLAMNGPAGAQDGGHESAMKEDKAQVNKWNQFADELLKLHKQQLANHEVTTKEKMGGYMRMPNYYKEVSYFDKKTGHLLSRVAWETENPDLAHTIEVFVRDDQGRSVRDYSAAFLPGFRNAPNQTLINFHHYEQGLHGFRSFDASGERIYEQCEGSLNGKNVWITLEDIQILDALREGSKGIMGSAEYKACFAGLPEAAGKYLNPQ